MSWEKTNKQRGVTRYRRALPRGTGSDVAGKFTPKLKDLYRAAQRRNWSAQHRPKTKAKVTLPTVTFQQQKDKAQ